MPHRPPRARAARCYRARRRPRAAQAIPNAGTHGGAPPAPSRPRLTQGPRTRTARACVDRREDTHAQQPPTGAPQQRARAGLCKRAREQSSASVPRWHTFVHFLPRRAPPLFWPARAPAPAARTRAVRGCCAEAAFGGRGGAAPRRERGWPPRRGSLPRGSWSASGSSRRSRRGRGSTHTTTRMATRTRTRTAMRSASWTRRAACYTRTTASSRTTTRPSPARASSASGRCRWRARTRVAHSRWASAGRWAPARRR